MNRQNQVLLLLTLCVTTVAAGGTSQQREPESREQRQAGIEAFYKAPVDDLIKGLNRDPSALTVVQRLRILNDPVAIGPLARAFERVDGELEKRIIAATLLSLGVGDGPYFELLAKPAREAARSEMPYPLQPRKKGEPAPSELDPTFLDWCRERGLDPNAMAHQATYEMPTALLGLGYARDPRAKEIFQEGLGSPNPLIVVHSVMGLDLLGQKDSIEPIIRGINRLPPPSRALPATWLLLFDDPTAQEFVRQWIPDEATRSAYLQAYREMIPRPRPKR